jgi:hypothetical protein
MPRWPGYEAITETLRLPFRAIGAPAEISAAPAREEAGVSPDGRIPGGQAADRVDWPGESVARDDLVPTGQRSDPPDGTSPRSARIPPPIELLPPAPTAGAENIIPGSPEDSRSRRARGLPRRSRPRGSEFDMWLKTLDNARNDDWLRRIGDTFPDE